MLSRPSGGSDGPAASSRSATTHSLDGNTQAKTQKMRYMRELLDELSQLEQLHEDQPGTFRHSETLLTAEMDRTWTEMRGPETPAPALQACPSPLPSVIKPPGLKTPKSRAAIPRLDDLNVSKPSPTNIMPGHLLPPPTFHLAKNDNGDDGHDEWTLQQKIPIPPNVRGRCNFIGRILGPRGISVRQMEAETGCSIVIRGQGSIKDPDRAARLHGVVGWEHLDEPLHCLITASGVDKSQARRKLDGAVSAVLNLLNNTNNDHKKQQLVQLAIINGTYRPDEPTPTTE